MSETMMSAVMSLIGTLVGTVSGIVAGNRLTAYRLQQLEEKVSKHNCLVERTYALEGRMNTAEEIIRDLKGGRYHE